ncbi:MAG: hypothetical protein AABY32_01460 [Nanoarchaeota archaeon]
MVVRTPKEREYKGIAGIIAPIIFFALVISMFFISFIKVIFT